MNLARILLTAAALTLQAMALSLIAPGQSRASQVYRCDDSSYQMQPCASTQSTTMINARDARSREQLKHASGQRAQTLKADGQINRRIAKLLKRPPRSAAMALGEPTQQTESKRAPNKPFVARVPGTPNTTVANARP